MKQREIFYIKGKIINPTPYNLHSIDLNTLEMLGIRNSNHYYSQFLQWQDQSCMFSGRRRSSKRKKFE
jgi:glycyl-tRNA synthetase alpha subunit